MVLSYFASCSTKWEQGFNNAILNFIEHDYNYRVTVIEHEYSYYKEKLYLVQPSAIALLSFVICPSKLNANYKVQTTGTILLDINTITTL